MLKLVAFAAIVATANGYLNHGGPLLAPAPPSYYGHFVGGPAYPVVPHANFLKSYVPPPAISPYPKNAAPSYETVEKPQVQVAKAVYTSYNPTVTNLPAQRASSSFSSGHYATLPAHPVPVHASILAPAGHRSSILAPAALAGHRYLQLGYQHAPVIPRMPYVANHLAPVSYAW